MTAICVQRFDDSLNSAIRITYRISLRSSSLREPRYPLPTVVGCFVFVCSARSRVRTQTLDFRARGFGGCVSCGHVNTK